MTKIKTTQIQNDSQKETITNNYKTKIVLSDNNLRINQTSQGTFVLDNGQIMVSTV